LANISAIAQASLAKTVETTVLLTYLGELSAVNEDYGQFLKDPCPALCLLPSGGRAEGGMCGTAAVWHKRQIFLREFHVHERGKIGCDSRTALVDICHEGF
jgi:hypothetical protein